MDVDVICLWKYLENSEYNDGVMYCQRVRKLSFLMTEIKWEITTLTYIGMALFLTPES